MKTNTQYIFIIAILFAFILLEKYYCSNSLKSNNEKLFSKAYLKKSTNFNPNVALSGKIK